MKLNKSDIDEKWTKAKNPVELFILTILLWNFFILTIKEQKCSIQYDTGTNTKSNLEQPKRVMGSREQEAKLKGTKNGLKSLERMAFPSKILWPFRAKVAK